MPNVRIVQCRSKEMLLKSMSKVFCTNYHNYVRVFYDSEWVV